MNSSPKHLSISEMWNLFLTLKSGLDPKHKIVMDEVISIMEKIDTVSFKKSLRIMYGDDFNKELTPIEYAAMFIIGLKKNKFFDFYALTETLNVPR